MDMVSPEILDIAKAFSSTKYLALSSFVLLIYDHLIYLDQEFEFFWIWRGEWSLTRALYFLNRYMPPLFFIVQFVNVFTPDLPVNFCTAAIRTSTSFMVFGMCVVEAILVTRVYFLWSHSRPMQCFICGTFAVCAIVAISFAGRAIHNLHGAHLPSVLDQPGCINVGDGVYWPIFASTFLIQTVLFAATVLRVLRPIAVSTNTTVVNRLLRDGGIFYCAVLVSVGFTMIGSLMLDHPKISMPALISNSLLAIHSICASHLILSIHSLAADMGSDPTFLLSNIEISRIAWRQGENENELIVDLGSRDSYSGTPLELIDLDPLGKDGGNLRGTSRVHTTRIGMIHRNSSRVDLAARVFAVYQPNV